VGKIRKRWLRETVSETGVEMLRAIKLQTDPQNIFGCGNLIP
jgi:FAD/FMN-containing dehydrogenase